MVENFNASWEGYFIFLGFSKWPHLEVVLFVVILIFYMMTLMGNLFIIILSHLDSHLHTPMYFFLSNLSALDLCYTTSSVPQLLFNLWGPKKTISWSTSPAEEIKISTLSPKTMDCNSIPDYPTKKPPLNGRFFSGANDGAA